MPSCMEWIHDYVASDASVPVPRSLVDRAPWLCAGGRDASLDTIASAVPRVLRSACSAPSGFGVAERRLFLLSAARWTRYRAPELARYVGCHRSNALKMLRCVEAAPVRCADRGDGSERNSRDAAVPMPTRRRGGAWDAEARVRRSPLNRDELCAMALALADSRLSAMPLLPARARPPHRSLRQGGSEALRA